MKQIGSLRSRSFCWRRPAWPFRQAWASASTGKDYVRLALVENEHRIRQAGRAIKKFLSSADVNLHNVIPFAQGQAR